MSIGGVYSLKMERLSAERQQSVIRLLMALMTSLLLLKYYFIDLHTAVEAEQAAGAISLDRVMTLVALFLGYSVAMWAMAQFKPDRLRETMAASSVVELVLIGYLIRSTAATSLPFYPWYVFYVVSMATRYGLQVSILALAASIASYTLILCLAPGGGARAVVFFPAISGFTGFLLVLALLFGQISERQMTYQASLSVVNEFRAELAALATSGEVIAHLISRTRELLNVEEAFFLPARRGVDGSEAPGLRSMGADPVLLATFREDGGGWNVEEMLREQRPLASNNLRKSVKLPEDAIARLGIKNLAAAPMMVRGTPVGVVYAANRRDRRLTNVDLQLLELIATQAAPVVENALLWERLSEAAASEERLRIARDLHDNFLQTLAAIKLHLERCKILVAKDAKRALEGIDRIHEIATRGLAEVRAYLSELRLMGPEPSRFREAITRCAADAAARGGFRTELDLKPPEEPMPPNTALAAFQILRELLNNAAAHSKANLVRVSVSAQDGKLELEVQDDGVGFDAARVRAAKTSEGHLGLVGVEERARQFDGSFTISSEPGKGARAVAVLSI